MRLFFISLLLLLSLLAGAVYFIAIPSIKSNISQHLAKVGIKDTKLIGFQASFTGVSIKRIESKKIIIQNLEAYIYWPQYFFNKDIYQIVIEKFSYQPNIIDLEPDLFIAIPNVLQKVDFEELPPTNLRKFEIILNNKTAISGHFKKTKNSIKGIFNANTKELNLNAEYEISKTSNKFSKLHADVKNLSVNNEFVELNRATGWLSYDLENRHTILAQLQAGSGSFLNAPLNNISLVSGIENETNTLLFRAFASGFPSIFTTTDIEWNDNFKIQNLSSNLSFSSSKELEKYLSLNNPTLIKESLKNLTLEKTHVSFKYLPERRFIDGPYPFSFKITEKEENLLSGTTLFYPKNSDIRGTLTGDKQIISTLSQLIPFKHEILEEGIIRLEGNLKN